MSSRRAHAKTRSGCSDCKRRRIKCDERKPCCTNCQKRGMTCSFQFFDPLPTPSPSISRPIHSGITSSVHVFSRHETDDIATSPLDDLLSHSTQQKLLEKLPAPDRLLFKDVLSNFAVHTVPTLAPGSAAQAAWRKAIPVFVEQYDFVLHGVLAIASLHLSSRASNDSERDRYQAMAASQMNAGMTQYRREVQRVGTGNAEALLTFSTTFTTFTNYTTAAECKEALLDLAAAATNSKKYEELLSLMVDAICRTLRSIRGALVILVPCWQHIRSGTLEPIVQRDWWPPAIPITPAEVDADKKLRALENMWSCPGREYEYAFDVFRAALKGLREAFALISRLEDHTVPGDISNPKIFDWTAIFDWPVSLSLEFLAQLENRRMEAWVIIAHYAMLPFRITGNLWIQGTGENMLSTAAIVIGKENWHWINWPAAVIGIELASLSCSSPAS